MVDFLMTMWRRIIHYENRKMSLMKYVRILILKRGEWNVVTFDEYEMLICVWNKNGVKNLREKYMFLVMRLICKCFAVKKKIEWITKSNKVLKARVWNENGVKDLREENMFLVRKKNIQIFLRWRKRKTNDLQKIKEKSNKVLKARY